MHQTPAPQRGFSLIELMMAVAILSLAIIPLLINQGTSSQNAVTLHARTMAFLLAENEILELLASDKPKLGKKTGTDFQGGVGFKWEREIQPIEGTKLVSINIKVYNSETGKKAAELSGFHPGKIR